MSNVSDVMEISRRIGIMPGDEIYVSSDLTELFRALRADHVAGEFPECLEAITVDFRLWAAAKAQRAFSDADEYTPEQGEVWLAKQGYDGLRIVKKTGKEVKWYNGNWSEAPRPDEKSLYDLLRLEATNEYFGDVFDIFQQMNGIVGMDAWSADRQKLLYVPEWVYLRFGPDSDQGARVNFSANDDPREDCVLPELSVRAIDREALKYLGLEPAK